MARWRRSKEQVAQDILSESKVCCVCEERKPFSEFYNFKNKSDGKSYRCKSCDYKARKGYQERNRERYAKNLRDTRLRNLYNIEPKDYELMLKEQAGCCAICGKPKEDNKVRGKLLYLAVDHDHKTGKVRGLLCNQCNRGLGMLGDTKEALMRAHDYLDCH